MNQYRYLFKNIGLLTLSSFATKLLSFFLVPLYTNVLTTTEYGTYDIFNTTVGVLLPILTLNIQESVIRFSMDENYDRKAIVTISIKYLLISNGIILIGLWANNVLRLSAIVTEYAFYFFLMFLAQSLSGIVTAYVRGIDRIKELSISSLFASIITIGLNIVFLVVIKLGLIGYFLANILGPLVQCVYLIVRTDILRNISLKNSFQDEQKAMVNYCKPMIANSIAWWVNNVSDRYVVIFFCGIAENGIYSVASKIPSILNIFQTIFSQAWTLSAVRDFDPEDKNGFFSNTYRAYNCVMVIVCSAIILLDKVLAKFLYAKDFYVAWKYVPWLTIAIVFGAMSGYIGGFFSAVKNSKIFAQSSLVGAVTNIVLNLIFTPLMGAMGAAVATTVCYFEIWAIRYWHSKRFVHLQVNLIRDIVSYILLLVQAIVLYYTQYTMVAYGIEIGLLSGVVFLYTKDIRAILSKIKTRG